MVYISNMEHLVNSWIMHDYAFLSILHALSHIIMHFSIFSNLEEQTLRDPNSPLYAVGKPWTDKHGTKEITPFNMVRMGLAKAESYGIVIEYTSRSSV